jgi:hypothetical protein
MLEDIVRDAPPQVIAAGLVEGPVDAKVDLLWPLSSSACDKDAKLRGRRGRAMPRLSRVTPLYSSETKVKAIWSVP